MPTFELHRPRPKTGATMRAAVAQEFGRGIEDTASVRDRHGGVVDVELRYAAKHLGIDHQFRGASTASLIVPAIERAWRLTEIPTGDLEATRQEVGSAADHFYTATLSVRDPALDRPGRPAKPQIGTYLTYVGARGPGRYRWASLYPTTAARADGRAARGRTVWEDGDTGRRNPAPAPPQTTAASRPDRATAREPQGQHTRPERRPLGKLAALLLGVALLARVAERQAA